MTSDIVFFKLYCAEYFLKKIPSTLLLTDKAKYFETQLFIESFLFFIVASLDALYDEINKKLNLGINNYYLTKCLEDRLSKSTSNTARSILVELQRHTQPPKHNPPKQVTEQYAHDHARKYLDDSWGLDYWERFEKIKKGLFYEHTWNRKHSSLWELRTLRNQIAHGSLIKPSSEMGGKNRSAISLHLVKNAIKPYDMHFIFNPNQYFLKRFNNTKNLIKNIKQILS